MCTATLQRQAEEDQVQTQVVIPNQDDQTELHKITMYHPDNRSSRIKGSHRFKKVKRNYFQHCLFEVDNVLQWIHFHLVNSLSLLTGNVFLE